MPRESAIVTGATRGIGKGIAIELARLGFDVAAVGTRSADQAADAVRDIEQHGASVVYVQADISRAGDRVKIVEETKAAFGRLDLLVNNAGVAPKVRADILEASEESFDRVLGINLKGPMFLTQIAANWMIEQKRRHPERDPMIVNISSVSAYASSPSRPEYCISKAGLSMLTALYADRLAEHGIRVYEIRPGIIETDMTSMVKEKYDRLIEGGLTPIKRWGCPQDVAKAVAAIAQGLLPFSTGEVINVDGGFHLTRL